MAAALPHSHAGGRPRAVAGGAGERFAWGRDRREDALGNRLVTQCRHSGYGLLGETWLAVAWTGETCWERGSPVRAMTHSDRPVTEDRAGSRSRRPRPRSSARARRPAVVGRRWRLGSG